MGSEASEFAELMAAAGEPTYGNYDGSEDGAADETSALGVALEAFHARLEGNESVLQLPPETLAAWQAQHDSSVRALGDETKEADMQRIAQKINARARLHRRSCTTSLPRS